MKRWEKLEKQLLKNPKVKAEYDKLEPEFALAEKIIKLRLAKKMTQADLAKKAGMQQSAIARIEQGETSPNYRTLYKLSDALGKKIELV